MAMTEAQVNKVVKKFNDVVFGVTTTDSMVNEMANRFLCWKLPKGFCPDAGISFNPSKPGNSWWPVGTNLLSADQAKEMILHMLDVPEFEAAAKVLLEKNSKINIPTREEMEEMLEAKLASDYPGESVESGENWELIAEIFFKAGFEAANAQRNGAMT